MMTHANRGLVDERAPLAKGAQQDGAGVEVERLALAEVANEEVGVRRELGLGLVEVPLEVGPDPRLACVDSAGVGFDRQPERVARRLAVDAVDGQMPTAGVDPIRRFSLHPRQLRPLSRATHAVRIVGLPDLLAAADRLGAVDGAHLAHPPKLAIDAVGGRVIADDLPTGLQTACAASDRAIARVTRRAEREDARLGALVERDGAAGVAGRSLRRRLDHEAPAALDRAERRHVGAGVGERAEWARGDESGAETVTLAAQAP